MGKSFGEAHRVVSRDQQSSRNLSVSHHVSFKGRIKRMEDYALAVGRDSLF